MATDKIITRKDGPVAHLVFNNPAKHNAMSVDMWEATERHLDDFIADSTTRVIVLSGEGGKAFVSGADISEFDSARASQEAVVHYDALTTRVYDLLYSAAKPTVAMIRGYCIGGGLALAACCDIRICADNSRFAIPAAKLGLGYGYTGLRRLVDLVGPASTKELFFTARQFTASEAAAMGLVNRVVSVDELLPYVTEYASTIAGNAPLTVASVKQIIGEITKDTIERDIEICESMVKACFDSEDYIEGRRAFKEKRKPAFSGR
jgi:enoyl-CoA hydratase